MKSFIYRNPNPNPNPSPNLDEAGEGEVVHLDVVLGLGVGHGVQHAEHVVLVVGHGKDALGRRQLHDVAWVKVLGRLVLVGDDHKWDVLAREEGGNVLHPAPATAAPRVEVTHAREVGVRDRRHEDPPG